MALDSAVPPATSRRLIITPAQHRLLEGLLRHTYLSYQQAVRLLHYRPSSLGYLQKQLARPLVRAGLLATVFLPRPGRAGSSPSLLCLTTRGLRYLADCGLEINGYRRPSERQHSYLFFNHLLAVNDVWISLELLQRHVPQFAIAQAIVESQLKRSPLIATGANGQRRIVVPDGWVELRLTTGGGVQQVCWSLECDLGTEEQQAWRAKIAAYLACLTGAYQERFQTTSLTIVVVTSSEARLLNLLRWTEAELTSSGHQDQADLWRFTACSPRDTDARAFFVTGQHWYRPFGNQEAIPARSRSLADYQPVPLIPVIATDQTSR